MRKGLKNLGSESRHVFTAEFVRFGLRNGWMAEEATCLFRKIKLGKKVVCDHLWFHCGKQFDALNLERGDIVEFTARVDSYIKGYRGYRDDVVDKPVERDWKLSRPTKVRKIGKVENPEPPTPDQDPYCACGAELSESHHERVMKARAWLNKKPPQYHAKFFDCDGKEIGETNSLEEILTRLEMTEDQWKCFFVGLVGSLKKGDEITLNFKMIPEGQKASPLFKFGVKVYQVDQYGTMEFDGFGFLKAAYALGWTDFPPCYIVQFIEDLDGTRTEKSSIEAVPLGGLSKWEMSVESPDSWKKTFEERRDRIFAAPQPKKGKKKK